MRPSDSEGFGKSKVRWRVWTQLLKGGAALQKEHLDCLREGVVKVARNANPSLALCFVSLFVVLAML